MNTSYLPSAKSSWLLQPRIATGKVQFSEHAQGICLTLSANQIVRLDSQSKGNPWIADFRCWTLPEVVILSACHKEYDLWGRECFLPSQSDDQQCFPHIFLHLTYIQYRSELGEHKTRVLHQRTPNALKWPTRFCQRKRATHFFQRISLCYS